MEVSTVSELEREIQELAALLNRLREVDKDFRVFGADSHKYRVGPKLSESEIQVFEKQHNIALPEDYRLYLQLIGNGNGEPWRERSGAWERGGAGPHYGLYPLAESALGDQINQSFPYMEEAKIPDDPSKPDDTEVPGIIEIAHQGCQGASYLVVQGPTYGTVWDGYDYYHFFPTGLTFREWYWKWAEKAIPLVMKEDVTNAVRVGMTVQEVIQICGDNGKRPDRIHNWILRFHGLHTEFEVDHERGDTIKRIIKASINPLSPYI